ncbi:MAG: precorrin-4 C(11)-methyltransferase [Alistipes sp.]|jgi:precorrin-4 C11-methyltransferase|nr:precorrin-4 C(11)-methyltransferase [Alistipes sp.]
MKATVINISPAGENIARLVAEHLQAERVALASLNAATFSAREAWVFVGAAGICVRAVAPFIGDKHTDPAVVCVDSTGRWVVPLLGGHAGGANDLARRLAGLLGAEAVVTTLSDNAGLWPLDTVGERFGWLTECEGATMNDIMARFVNRRPTALLVGIRDRGAHYLETTAPPHVTRCYRSGDIPADAELVIALSPRVISPPEGVPMLRFIPRSLTLGVGCRRGADPTGAAAEVERSLRVTGWHRGAVGVIATIELKKDEPLVRAMGEHFAATLTIYTAEELAAVEVPNPSGKALAATGSPSIAEAAARLGAHGGELVIEKQRRTLTPGADFTFAVAEDALTARRGHIEIVGAGPGDPDLISVRGRQFLEQADLILYAGSLVPREVTACARPSATVLSSAAMTLDEQFALMRDHYDCGGLVVRLHTGDPCIYGAIGEQMAWFDAHGMSYHITPGISSFQAAAAELQSQFTIPERVQTIILTRGEGRTPMPEREKLSLLARSQSTMCIFLSTGIAAEVQSQLLEHYPPTTPIAVCHHLTWPDQRIWRGELSELADIVERGNLTLTTMIVVGEAIGNRGGESRLYAADFKHIFRP